MIIYLSIGGMLWLYLRVTDSFNDLLQSLAALLLFVTLWPLIIAGYFILDLKR